MGRGGNPSIILDMLVDLFEFVLVSNDMLFSVCFTMLLGGPQFLLSFWGLGFRV